MIEVDRRTFLTLTSAALAVPAALTAPEALAVPAARASDSGAAAAVVPGQWRDSVIVNALGGLEDPNPKPSDARVIREAHASGLTAVNVTLGYVFGDMEPFETSVRDIAKTDAQILADPKNLLKVYTAADILRAKAERKIGLIYGFQNAAMLGSDTSRVEIFAGLGVRVIQLTYNAANQLGDGSVVVENRGLSPLGHD
jgi:membrane dipeptidase